MHSRAVLRRNGIVPDTALSGAECIELVKKNKYHIIFMDHMMPHMDGIETYEYLCRENLIEENTAVIAMTANAVTGAMENYLSHGFCGYISKPIVAEKLESELEKHLPKNLVSYRNTGKLKNSGKPIGVTESSFPDNCSFLDTAVGM